VRNLADERDAQCDEMNGTRAGDWIVCDGSKRQEQEQEQEEKARLTLTDSTSPKSVRDNEKETRTTERHTLVVRQLSGRDKSNSIVVVGSVCGLKWREVLHV
jgi:hypothetical protein